MVPSSLAPAQASLLWLVLWAWASHLGVPMGRGTLLYRSLWTPGSVHTRCHRAHHVPGILFLCRDLLSCNKQKLVSHSALQAGPTTPDAPPALAACHRWSDAPGRAQPAPPTAVAPSTHYLRLLVFVPVTVAQAAPRLLHSRAHWCSAQSLTRPLHNTAEREATAPGGQHRALGARPCVCGQDFRPVQTSAHSPSCWP